MTCLTAPRLWLGTKLVWHRCCQMHVLELLWGLLQLLEVGHLKWVNGFVWDRQPSEPSMFRYQPKFRWGPCLNRIFRKTLLRFFSFRVVLIIPRWLCPFRFWRIFFVFTCWWLQFLIFAFVFCWLIGFVFGFSIFGGASAGSSGHTLAFATAFPPAWTLPLATALPLAAATATAIPLATGAGRRSILVFFTLVIFVLPIFIFNSSLFFSFCLSFLSSLSHSPLSLPKIRPCPAGKNVLLNYYNL